MSEVIDAPHGRGNFSFGSEDIAQLAAGLESALANLGIKDRNDPTTTLLAKLIIQLAKMASAIRRAWRKGRSGLCAALVKCGSDAANAGLRDACQRRELARLHLCFLGTVRIALSGQGATVWARSTGCLIDLV
jgi:hypothetical protein